MKTAQHLEGGFRSRTPPGMAYEVAGHVVLALLIRRLIVKAAARHEAEPLRIRFGKALRELQHMWSTIVVSSPAWVAWVL